MKVLLGVGRFSVKCNKKSKTNVSKNGMDPPVLGVSAVN